jgi:hypothetical protein
MFFYQLESLLVRRPYWFRAWIIQEIDNADSVVQASSYVEKKTWNGRLLKAFLTYFQISQKFQCEKGLFKLIN